MQECLFCKIATREIPAKIHIENEYVIAFDDIRPSGRVHILIVPKNHIIRVDQISSPELALAFVQAILELKKTFSLAAYKIQINNGPESGQIVPHLHWHLISNWFA